MKMTRQTVLTVLATAMLLAAPAGSQYLRAQEPEVTWTPHEKARIGVLLEERCGAEMVTADNCEAPPVVTSVVVNGPADVAGILARDTLLTIDGLAVTSPAGREALLNLEAGVAVQLQLARESGRLTLRVTPELRAEEPYVEVRTMFFGPGPEISDMRESVARARTIRIPSVRSRLDEVEIRLDSLSMGENDFVFFHEDSAGTFKIEVGDPEKAVVMLQRLRQREDGPRDSRMLERTRTDAEYVWENEELARRLSKVRDSAFRSARVHLDSLVRLQHRFQVVRNDSLGFGFSITSGADPDGEWAYFVGPRRLPEQVRTLFTTDFRMAGAEFRELHGDLAEYFEGADQGLLVIRIIPETPASRTGLREGDVVVEVNGAKCDQISVLREAMAAAGPSGELQLVWVRKGSRHTGQIGMN